MAVEHEMANELNEDLIWLCHSCAAACQVSNGDGTLQVPTRLASEGVNATDGDAYLAELCHQLDCN